MIKFWYFKFSDTRFNLQLILYYLYSSNNLRNKLRCKYIQSAFRTLYSDKENSWQFQIYCFVGLTITILIHYKDRCLSTYLNNIVRSRTLTVILLSKSVIVVYCLFKEKIHKIIVDTSNCMLAKFQMLWPVFLIIIRS